jgi:DNA-binding NarL/FixJ family response regulator
MKKLRILIVDDHPFFRSGLAQWLNQQEGLICCGEADSIKNARISIDQLKPDVVLVDLRMGDGEGLDLIQDTAQHYPEMRLIALSQFDEDVYAHRSLQAGARGYLMKSEATESVLDAVHKVVAGGIHLSPRMSAKLLHNIFPDPAAQHPDLAKLSNRELQVFHLLGSGMSTIQVAKHLNLSHKTVETYRENLKQKLGLADALALVSTAKRWMEEGRLDAGS